MTAVRDMHVALLRQHPEGMTTRAIAVALNRKPSTTSSLLSKAVYPGYVLLEMKGPRGRQYAVWKAAAE